MRTKLLNVMMVISLLLISLSAQAATVILKYTDFPNTPTLQGTDLFLIGDPGVTNKNINWNQLRAAIGTNPPSVTYFFLSYVTNQYVTLQYVTNQYVAYTTNNYQYVTNQYVTFNTNNYSYVTNQYVTYNTNLYSYVTNQYVTYNTNDYSYVTNEYVTYATNLYQYVTNQYVNLSYVTNQYVTTNYSAYSYVTNLFVTYLISTNNYFDYITNNYIYNTNLFSSNAYITNITANKITVNNIYSGDTTATNGFYIGTNYFAGPTNTVDLRFQDQYYLTYTPVSVTGFINKSNTVVEGVIVTVTNAASTNVLLTLPAGLVIPERTNQVSISNASQGMLSIRYSPLAGTNGVYRQF